MSLVWYLLVSQPSSLQLHGRGLSSSSSLILPPVHLISGPSCLPWDFIPSVAPFPVFSSFSSLLAPRMYAQAPAFYLLDLTKGFSKSSFFFFFNQVSTQNRLYSSVTDSLKLCQSPHLQLHLFSGMLLHSPASSPHLDHRRCLLTHLPAPSLPFSSLSFPLLQSHLLKYRYDHITPLSLKPSEAQHCLWVQI